GTCSMPSYSKESQLSRGERRYRRKVASPKQLQAIRAAKCLSRRVCSTVLSVQSHHIVPRDRFGDDIADNIAGLCASCHDGVGMREVRHCRLLLSRLSDAEYTSAVGKLGEGGLEALYGVEFER